MIRNVNGTATLPNASSFNALAQQHGLVSLKPMSPKPNSAFRKYFEVRFPQNANLQAIENAFQNNPHVEWASRIPAEILEPLGPYIPPDPFMQNDHSWFLNQGTNIADINAPEAWEWSLGDPNIIIAICGGGIKAVTEPNHTQYSADVAANLWTNPGEIPSNGIDDDGNGYVDDIHGWNFRLNNNDIEYKDPGIPTWDPLWWHGTPMASEAASAIDNCTASNCGVGVAPLCEIMGVPHATGESIVYAVDNGAKVLAYAFPSSSGYMYQFVKDAFFGGMLVVNAAGNTIGGTLYDYPPYGISVATLDPTNYTITTTGPSLKICAPAQYGGSSYATPVVAGVLALMMAKNQFLSPLELRTILLDTNSTNPVNCRYPLFCFTGSGRVDAFKAVKNSTATATLNSVTPDKNDHPLLSWDHNRFVGSGVFPTSSLQYVIQRRIEGEPSFSDIATVAGTATKYTDTDLIIAGFGDPTAYRIITRVNYDGNFALSVPSNTEFCRTSTYKIIGSDENNHTQTQLIGNYPNPFNPTTSIAFTLASEGSVSLRIFDVLGKEVTTLLDRENRKAGGHTVPFNASSLAGGMYYCRFEANGYVSTQKIILIK